MRLVSEEPLEKLNFYIKYYDQEEKKSEISFHEIYIPSARTGYYLSDISDPLSIAIDVPFNGDYAIHIVGYPKNSDDSIYSYYVVTRCYSISDVVNDNIFLVGLDQQLDNDMDTVPDDFIEYCQRRDELGYDCEQECDSPSFSAAYDCNSEDSQVHPFIKDTCGDGIDRDCWAGDESCEDKDSDGFASDTDCNDDNPDIHPGATEICGNGIDENCTVDRPGCNDGDLPCDNDGDGYETILYAGCGTDCNDIDPAIHPEAQELCGDNQRGNGVDEDCDGFTDEGCIPDDLDGDGYLDKSVGGNDCNDCDPGINPGVSEKASRCNDGIDQSCDNGNDDQCPENDNDADWFSTPDDCNDNDQKVYPEAPDICGDDIAYNCLLETSCEVDLDGDRFNSNNDCNDSDPAVNPGIEGDICDGIDNNCNSIVDEVWISQGGRHQRGCIIGSAGNEDVDFGTDIRHCGQCRYDCRTNAADNINAIGDRCVDGECQCGSSGTICPAGGEGDLWACCMAGENSYCTDLYHNNNAVVKEDCGYCGNICEYGDGTNWGFDCVEGDCLCNGAEGYVEKCDDGITCCRGEGCIDLNNDVNNCGSCSNDCNAEIIAERPIADRCEIGICRCGHLPKCSGTTWCVDDPRTQSGKNCLDFQSDKYNCGNIGHVCGSNSQCIEGICVCTEDRSDCNGNGSGDDTDGCETNLLTDSDNCGECENKCGEGVSCINGNCACGTGGDCPSSQACCNDSYCADLDEDENNCGYCGYVCSSTNSTSRCNRGDCNYVCNSPYGNCNGSWDDGCETNLSSDVQNCGACQNYCGVNTVCTNRNCYCAAPFDNCDISWSNGCEINTNTDINNCGDCDNVCSAPHSTAVCNGGNCVYTCISPYQNCNGGWGDGCECSTCCDGTGCVNPTNGRCCVANDCGTNGVCNDNDCGCSSGYANCDNSWNNGCEKDILNDNNNCGSCGYSCCGTNGCAEEECRNGNCYCSEPFGNCDNDWSNGCEINTSNDNNNCGSCGHRCGPNSSCVNGICRCSQGTSDCDGNGTGDDLNGCETNILNNNNNCGGCGNQCRPGSSCVNGNCSCGVSDDCLSGETCCNNSYCSNMLTDVNNCGYCGSVCGPGETCSNGQCRCGNNAPCGDNQTCCQDGICVDFGGTGFIGDDCCGNIEDPICNATYHTSCSSHSCSCGSGYLDCNRDLNCECSTCCDGISCVIVGDGDVSDGCCSDCSSSKHTTCSNYRCNCSTNYYDCNSDGNCECNSCCDGTSCVTVGGGRCCTTSQCSSNAYCGDSRNCFCNTGYANCNNLWTDGCEININTDANNCGRCLNKCGPNASCSNGLCVCNSGYANCNSNWTDGCEINITNNSNNCGGCGNSCGLNAFCNSGNCTCSTGYANCNNNWSDGCEINTNSSLSNCGSCGNNCGQNSLCNSGVCSCNTGYLNCNSNWSDGCECGSCCNGTTCVVIGDGDVGEGCCGTCNPSNHTTCTTYRCYCQSGYSDCNTDGNCECNTGGGYQCSGTSCCMANATRTCSVNGNCCSNNCTNGTCCGSSYTDCDSNGTCECNIGAGYQCSGTTCCMSNGSRSCSLNGNCCSNNCTNGTCCPTGYSDCNGDGVCECNTSGGQICSGTTCCNTGYADCDTNGICECNTGSGYQCSGTACCRANATRPCTGNGDCCSNNCTNSTCCAANYSDCDANGTCECNTGGSYQCSGSSCCMSSSRRTCTVNSTCCSNNCTNNTCCDVGYYDCNADSTCECNTSAGYQCSGTVCCKPSGITCGVSSECCSNNCNAGFCD